MDFSNFTLRLIIAYKGIVELITNATFGRLDKQCSNIHAESAMDLGSLDMMQMVRATKLMNHVLQERGICFHLQSRLY